ncbi:hypothetical protein JHK84_054789 [Glycine max]|nr:hypothetical protein JHK85_055722 [Glycine max]KAG5073558.1 hypothetical protein JHK84_054789 [Glycine max]
MEELEGEALSRGFTRRREEKQHYMKYAYVFLPEYGNTKVMLALSAIARAMKEMNKEVIRELIEEGGLLPERHTLSSRNSNA